MPIRIMLVEGSTLFRQGFRHLLPEGDFEIAAEAARWQEAAAKFEDGLSVDLILIDAPDTATVVQAVTALRKAAPNARVVHLAAALDAERIMGALEAGADGIVSKDRSPEAVAQSLRLVAIGEKVLPQDVAEMLVRRPGPAPADLRSPRGLSAREAQILGGLLRGHSNKMIANELSITEATVKVHLKSLLRKIGCSNRTQAAIWAMNNGFAAERPAEKPTGRTSEMVV